MPDQNEVELPPFVIDGTHEDPEWREAASTPAERRNRQQAELAVKAPARHPYGPQAILDERSDGQRRWFPSQEARDAYVNANEADFPQRPEPSALHQAPQQAKLERKSREEAIAKGTKSAATGV